MVKRKLKIGLTWFFAPIIAFIVIILLWVGFTFLATNIGFFQNSSLLSIINTVLGFLGIISVIMIFVGFIVFIVYLVKAANEESKGDQEQKRLE